MYGSPLDHFDVGVSDTGTGVEVRLEFCDHIFYLTPDEALALIGRLAQATERARAGVKSHR